MTDLERRALMGDKQAQEECTRKGVLLPCPFCGSENIRTSNWGMWRCWCPECIAKSDDCLRERDAIKKWNTRPEIERCGDCLYWAGTEADSVAPCRENKNLMFPKNGYCYQFSKKGDK